MSYLSYSTENSTKKLVSSNVMFFNCDIKSQINSTEILGQTFAAIAVSTV